MIREIPRANFNFRPFENCKADLRGTLRESVDANPYQYIFTNYLLVCNKPIEQLYNYENETNAPFIQLFNFVGRR